jgi:hypothetical protein
MANAAAAPAATTTPDNNIAATQAANASFAASNPNTFTNPASSTQPNFNSINSGNLQSTTQVQLPPPPPPSTTQANGIVAGAGASLQSTIASLTPAPTAADQQQQSILDSIASLTGQDAQKGADTLSLEQQNGVQAKQQSVTDATNEIATKTANYNNLQANLGGNNSTETSAVLAAQNAGLTKAAAADIGVSQAKLTAAQGNLSLAQQQVTNAINLKYSTIEANIQTQQAQLAALAPVLDAEQKTQALAQQKVLQDQADAVATQKANEAQVQSIALQAAANGATQGIMAAITAATDPNVAIQLAAPYLAKAPTQVVEVNGHSLLIDSQTGKTVQDLGESNSVIQANIAHGGSGTGGVSSIVDPATDAAVKAIIASKPGDGGYGDAYNAVAAKFGAQVADAYDSQYQQIFNNGQSVDAAFSGSGSPSLNLTATQIGVVNKANAAVNNSKTGIAFQNATNAYNAISTIDPTTINPAQQQQALINLAQLEFPGTNSARGLLTVNPATAQNSDFANALIKAQQTLQAKGSLSGGVIAQLQSQAKTIYSTIQSSYTSAYNANVVSVAKTLGISQTQAKQYLTNYNSQSSSSGSAPQSAQSLAQSKGYDYDAMKKAGYSDQDIINALQ